MLLCAALDAAADSAVGVNPAGAHALNPTGLDPTRERDSRGMSLFVPEPSRTPSGFLYDRPYAPTTPTAFAATPPGQPPEAAGVRRLEGAQAPSSKPRLTLGQEGSGWTFRLSTEFGVLATPRSDKAPEVRDYGDYSDGFMLNYFSLGFDRAGTGHYFDVTAGAVGREDQHYRANFGRYGGFKTTFYFNQLAKFFTENARTVFQGAGTGNLTLVPGLVPGNNTPAQVSAALQAASPFELGYTRKKAGVDFDATPGSDWRLYARYAQEQKTGTRPSGGAFSYPGAALFELIEPLDYKTHDVLTGVQWTGGKLQANLGYSGSFFRNAIDTLTWENPLVVGDPAVMQRGRMDLYPDNDFHNLKLDLSAALPMRGRISGGASWGRMTQDDDLIAPTVNSGNLGGINLADWNTTGALSQKTANARIDTQLYHLSGSFSPLRDLSVQAKARRFEQDNKTAYTAFNPQTGQSGYLGLDGGVNNIVPNNAYRAQIQAVPFEYRKDNYGVDADYRLLRRTNVTLGYERENTVNPYRELGRTGEDRVRAAVNNRDLPRATIRLSYEHADRSGEPYNFDPNRQYYAPTSLTNVPATLADLRKYDIADRRQQIVNGRVNFLLARDMDLAVSGRYVDNEYGAAYGRLDERIGAFNVEWSWQLAPRASTYVNYGFERMRSRMATISDDPAGYATGDPNAGGPVYPLANRWDAESRDDAHTINMGFRYGFGRSTLEAGYAWIYSPFRTRYTFASPGALAGGPGAAGGAGDGMPDIKFRQQVLETSLKVALTKDTALRFYYRYEHADFEDSHYDNLPLVLGAGEAVFLGAGPRNYTDSLFGVFYQYTPGKRENTRQ